MTEEELVSQKLPGLKQRLMTAVERRIKSIPFEEGVNDSVAVMFSGGLDSTLIAAILGQVLDPPSLGLDLINVSFEADTSADRITSIFSFKELCDLFPDRQIRMLCADYPIKTVMDHKDFMMKLTSPKTSHMDFNIGSALHFASKAEGYVFDKAFFAT